MKKAYIVFSLNHLKFENQNPRSMHTFLLADDHAIVRRGMRLIIEDHFTCRAVDEAENGEQLAEKVKANPYDVILLDIEMPDNDLSTLIPWIKMTQPAAEVLVLTGQPEHVFGLRCMRLGASAFLTKDAAEKEIVDALQSLLLGKKFVTPSMAEILIESEGEVAPIETLSDREMQIAMMLEKGTSLPEICRQLHIQYSTVNTYKRRIFEKLHIGDLLSLSKLLHAYGIGRS